MATILTFSPQGAGARAAQPGATPAEIIVFPRTDVRALRRLSDGGEVAIEHPVEAPGEKDLV